MVLISQAPSSERHEIERVSNQLADDYIYVLHLVTQDTRYGMLQNIVGHPKGAPSLEELTFMSTKVSNQTTVHEHLKKLLEVGVVEKIKVKNQDSGYPRVFYRIRDEAFEFLQDRGLLEDVTALRQIYRSAKKPDRIKELEEAPRGEISGYQGKVDVETVQGILQEYVNQHEDPDRAIEALREIQDGNGCEDQLLTSMWDAVSGYTEDNQSHIG